MTHQYKDITYKLTRSKRKTASIHIERDGQVSVIAPEHLSEGKINQVIEQKRYWIYKNLAEWQDLNATKVQREFVNGESFLYLGRHYRLKWVQTQDQPLILKNGYFLLRKPTNGHSNPAETFKEFYRCRGQEKLSQRVAYYAPKMGVAVNKLRVLELKNRWASCTPSGNINFHWKCMMAPLNVVDYIVVHELAHLHHPNHTQAFWNEVDKILPDYHDRQQWLRINGAGMDL